MILEGLCTTRNPDGTINVAPMGPIVDEPLTSFLFRPFQTSTTYANLRSKRCGVFHVTDDVLLIAQAAVGRLEQLPEMFPATKIDGAVITKACRWYEFEVTSVDDSRERTEIQTSIRHVGRIRDYFGLNRAKHAILETAILATRLHLIPPEEVQRQMASAGTIVEKTGGLGERAAWEFLTDFIESHLPQPGRKLKN